MGFSAVQQQIQETAVQKAASTSVISAAAAALPIVTDALQAVAALVAIISGVMAFVWHRRRIRAKELEIEHMQEQLEQLRQLRGDTDEQPESPQNEER